MTALSSYSTGTVSVADGGTTVTGVGTIWSGVNVRPGDILQIGEFQTIISDVPDTSTLTIPPWGGGDQTDVAYAIWQWFPQRVAGAEVSATVNKLVAALEADGFIWFVDADLTEPDPSLGDEGQFAQQPSTGKTWVKDGGVWDYLGLYKPFRFTGAYNGSTTYSVGDVMTDAGASYVWINETPGSGHTAPNITYWQLLAAKGDAGDAATVTVGSVTTVAYGSPATVTNSGTSDAAVLDFEIPAGAPGSGDMTSTNNLSELTNAATARSNLGLTESIVTATVGQLPGTTGTTQPAAGKIGERVSASGSASLTSSTAANVASITPTAGVHDLEMVNVYAGPGGTTSSDWTTVISTVNASTSSGVVGESYHTRLPSGADISIVHSSRRIRITTTGSTTYYLNARAVYTGASYSCTGTIQATRVS